MIGAYAIEKDYSHYIAQASDTVLAVVSTASKGPIGEVTAITSSQDLSNKFGPVGPNYLGLYAGQYFLGQSSRLYFIRVAGSNVASAKIVVPGESADETAITSALEIELTEKGTFGNGYTLEVKKNQTSYDLIIKNANSITIENIKGISLSDLTEGYTTTYVKFTSVDATAVSIDAGLYTFAGGNDGSTLTSADYITAIDKLAAQSLDINLIAVPGVSDADVINEGLKVAEDRGDTLYIVDTPSGLDRDGVIEWVNGGSNYSHTKFNSSYGAVYYDWVYIYDPLNKIQVQVPPSVVVGATYAYSDRISDLWYAPAGLTRGIIRGALSTSTELTRGDIELLYDSNINSIYNDPQIGLVLWGQKTLYRETTALDRVNVRRLMNYIKKVVTAACSYLVFEPNDRITWNSFEMKVTPILDSIKARRGLYEYKIVEGESVVTPDDIDNYRIPCVITIRPTKAAEEIPVYFMITSTGAEFNEILDANGIVVIE